MKYQKTKKRWKYRLAEPYVFRETVITGVSSLGSYINLYTSGSLFLDKGYAWDGSSIPFKGLIPWNTEKHCMIASLIHDALYQLIRTKRLSYLRRKRADEIYRDLCIKGGMSKWQANLRYKMLRRFGKIKPEKENPVLEASFNGDNLNAKVM